MVFELKRTVNKPERKTSWSYTATNIHTREVIAAKSMRDLISDLGGLTKGYFDDERLNGPGVGTIDKVFTGPSSVSNTESRGHRVQTGLLAVDRSTWRGCLPGKSLTRR
jgi:hypothetical protein